MFTRMRPILSKINLKKSVGTEVGWDTKDGCGIGSQYWYLYHDFPLCRISVHNIFDLIMINYYFQKNDFE